MVTSAPFRWLPPAAAFLLSASGGWWLDRKTVESESPVPAVTPPVLPAPTPAEKSPAFAQWLASLDAAECAAALAERALKPPGPLSALEEHLILVRWAHQDPAACVAWMIAQKRTGSLDQALRIWGERFPDDVWTVMAGLPLSQEEKSRCFDALCKALTDQDPDHFLSLPLPSEGWKQRYENARLSAFRKLAQTNPERAMTRVFEAGEIRKFDIDNIAGIWGKAHPGAALAWSLQAGHPPREIEFFQRAAVAAWAETDAEAAAAFLVSQPALLHGRSTEKPDPRAAVIARLAAADMKRSMEWLGQHFSESEQPALVKDLRRVLPHDMSEWLPDFFAAVPESPRRDAMLTTLLSGEPGYPRKIDLSILQNIQPLATTAEWLHVIRKIAAEHVGFAPNSAHPGQLADLHGPVRAAVALEFAKRSPNPKGPDLILAALTEDPGFLTDPDIAAVFKTSTATGLAVLEKLGHRENSYREAAAHWAAKDAPAAAGWIGGLADERSRADAAGPLITEWCRTDEYAASQWTAALPPGPARDAAASSLAARLTGPAPADAWTWMMSVPDAAEVRQDQLRDIAASWRKADPAAADAAIRAAPLPAPLRDQLLTLPAAP